MDPFFLPIQFNGPPNKIQYPQKILLCGSCFTEHIGHQLAEMKFDVLQNPNGILFDPLSVVHSLISYIKPQKYRQEDLFYLNELWQSWDHHSRFSETRQQFALDLMMTARAFFECGCALGLPRAEASMPRLHSTPDSIAAVLNSKKARHSSRDFDG